jgi:hypothetical protein
MACIRRKRGRKKDAYLGKVGGVIQCPTSGGCGYEVGFIGGKPGNGGEARGSGLAAGTPKWTNRTDLQTPAAIRESDAYVAADGI